MCGGMEYLLPGALPGETCRVIFPTPKAKIPIRRDEGLELHQWGIREWEEGALDGPQTGWARHDKLETIYWQKYKPEPVLIPAIRFSEKGSAKVSCWFDMPDEAYIMGLKLKIQDQSLVYVVTVDANSRVGKIHPRMPYLVDVGFKPVQLPEECDPPEQQMKLFKLNSWCS